ncbi:unnamed protein product [Bathycoccus prasinos]
MLPTTTNTARYSSSSSSSRHRRDAEDDHRNHHRGVLWGSTKAAAKDSSFSSKWEAKIVRFLLLWTLVLLLSNLSFPFSSFKTTQTTIQTTRTRQRSDANGNKTTSVSPEEGKFLDQISSLLLERVPISLSKRRLRSNLEFTCGGSHVVKMHEIGLQRGWIWKTNEDVADDGGTETKSSSSWEESDDGDDALGSSRSSGSSSSRSSVQKRKKKRYKSCAVVGNSGSLLETQFGFDIDKNEAVIRFNAAVTQGYEQFVGQKTTVRLLNAVDYKGPEGTEGELRLTTARGSDVKTWVKKLEQKPEDIRNRSFVLDPEMLCHAWAWIGKHGEKPSSGLVGVVLALKMCEKVEMFGFQSKNYFGKFSRPHYYDWERPQKGREKVHPFQREVDLYQNLEKFGYLTTYT